MMIRTHTALGLMLVLTLGVAGAAHAGEKVTLPAGARLMVGLDDALDTGENKEGDRFGGYLDASLTVDGQTVADRGTKVYGRIRELKKAGRFRGKAELVLELTDIRIDDELVPIMTDRITVDGEEAKTLRRAGGGAVAGAVVGTIAGGGDSAAAGAVIGAAAGTTWGAITGSNQVTLERETLLEFRLDRQVSVSAQ